MEMNKQKLSRAEEKLLIAKMVSQCRERALLLMKQWRHFDKSLPTKDGCIYIRLSTESQVLVEGGSLLQQVNISFEDVADRSRADQVNYRIVEIFIDAGISGQTDDRPELQRLKSQIKKQKFSFVAMKDMTRIFRHATLFSLFFEECNAVGCEVMFKGFPINPNDPNDVFRLRMHSALAEYEARNTSKRVRENLFSAMVHNGKFNSTHRVLGLDQLVVNGVPMVGLYTPNRDELKIVEWIMDTFDRVASYQVTLQEIDKRGIKNKNGRPFKEHSLFTLLTNLKYVGRWELNPENQGKDTRKLMSYDQHRIVDLPHGCVINMDLWNRVQATVARLKGNKAKNTRLERVYLLSGLLRSTDGTRFGGSGNWGKSKTKRANYYMNTTHGFRLSADAVELEARRIVTEIIKQSPKLQTAIVERTKSIRSSLDLLQGQVELIDAKIAKVQKDRAVLDKRLDFLLSTDDSTQADVFRQEYVESVNRLKGEHEELQRQRTALERGRADLEDDELNTGSLIARAEKIQVMIQERDPVALKNAYKALFSEIVVGELDKNGRRELRFRVRGSDPLEGVLSGGTKSGIVEELAQEEGLEPPTKRLTAACSTD